MAQFTVASAEFSGSLAAFIELGALMPPRMHVDASALMGNASSAAVTTVTNNSTGGYSFGPVAYNKYYHYMKVPLVASESWPQAGSLRTLDDISFCARLSVSVASGGWPQTVTPPAVQPVWLLPLQFIFRGNLTYLAERHAPERVFLYVAYVAEENTTYFRRTNDQALDAVAATFTSPNETVSAGYAYNMSRDWPRPFLEALSEPVSQGLLEGVAFAFLITSYGSEIFPSPSVYPGIFDGLVKVSLSGSFYTGESTAATAAATTTSTTQMPPTNATPDGAGAVAYSSGNDAEIEKIIMIVCLTVGGSIIFCTIVLVYFVMRRVRYHDEARARRVELDGGSAAAAAHSREYLMSGEGSPAAYGASGAGAYEMDDMDADGTPSYLKDMTSPSSPSLPRSVRQLRGLLYDGVYLSVTGEKRMADGTEDDIVYLVSGQPAAVGNYSTIYRGTYRRVNIALKLYRRARYAESCDNDVSNTETQIAMAMRLRHEHLMRFLGLHYMHANNTQYAVMELCDYGALAPLLAHRQAPEAFEYSDITAAAVQLSSAVAYLHAQAVLHRAVSPRSVLASRAYDKDASRIVVRLGCLEPARRTRWKHEDLLWRAISRGDAADTTISRAAAVAAATSNSPGVYADARSYTDSPYSAPEVLSSGAYSEASDMWAVGMTVLALFNAYASNGEPGYEPLAHYADKPESLASIMQLAVTSGRRVDAFAAYLCADAARGPHGMHTTTWAAVKACFFGSPLDRIDAASFWQTMEQALEQELRMGPRGLGASNPHSAAAAAASEPPIVGAGGTIYAPFSALEAALSTSAAAPRPKYGGVFYLGSVLHAGSPVCQEKTPLDTRRSAKLKMVAADTTLAASREAATAVFEEQNGAETAAAPGMSSKRGGRGSGGAVAALRHWLSVVPLPGTAAAHQPTRDAEASCVTPTLATLDAAQSEEQRQRRKTWVRSIMDGIEPFQSGGGGAAAVVEDKDSNSSLYSVPIDSEPVVPPPPVPTSAAPTTSSAKQRPRITGATFTTNGGTPGKKTAHGWL